MTAGLSKLAIIVSAMMVSLFGHPSDRRPARDPEIEKMEEEIRKLTVLPRDLTPQQLNNHLQNFFLKNARLNLLVCQKSLMKLKGLHPENQRGIEYLTEQADRYQRELDRLERGYGGSPVMPVEPRRPQPPPRQKD